MADGWYVSREGKVLGPYAWERVLEYERAGLITVEDMVMRPGSAEWVPADTVPAFFAADLPAVTLTSIVPTALASAQPAVVVGAQRAQSGRGAFYMVRAGAIETGLPGDGSTEESGQPVSPDPADLNPPVTWGPVPEKVRSSGDWKVLSTGRHHGVGIKTDGTLWAWGRLTEIEQIVGYDHAVQVGEDSDWVRVQADETGIDHTYATKRDGTVWVLRHK